MKIINKILTAGAFALMLVSTPLWAQPAGEAPNDTVLTHFETNNPQSGIGVDVTNFQSVQACYVANQDLFVVIDSTDNSVDLIFRRDHQFDTTIRVFVDEYKGRHDLPNVLRPKSVGFCDGYVVFLASSKKDSSFLAVVDMSGKIVRRIDFNFNAYAFQIFPDELIIVGRNQLGYDIKSLDLCDGIAGISHLKINGEVQPYILDLASSILHLEKMGGTKLHYHLPKQADRIKQSDNYGIGLTVVAVSVVFLALLSISLILKGYGKLIMKTQDRKANKSAKNSDVAAVTPLASQTSGEIYAAIATAIFLYDEEMHDEEDTIITIQKVERAWTPWNAKYYNMNHYFNNIRK